MSSAAIKALAARRTIAPANTSMAGWGRSFNQQLGLGYRPRFAATSPVGMLLKGGLQVGVGYGQCVALLAGGRVSVWGLNKGSTLPAGVGPEGAWAGIWQYRKPGLSSSPRSQQELEAKPWSSTTSYGVTANVAGFYTNLVTEGGKTYESIKANNEGHPPASSGTWWKETSHKGIGPAEIEAAERALTFPARTVDGRKGLIGQVVYIKGHIVTYAGQTWEALRENCNTPPGSDASAWTNEIPQVPQFVNPRTGNWYINAFNIGAPSRPAQLRGVAGVAMIAARGAAVMVDGSIREWGRVTNLGAGGVNFNASFGPKKRPLRPPPAQINPFHGTVFRGALSGSLSTVSPITALPVSSTGAELLPGLPVVLDDGAGHTQSFIPSAVVAKGATSIPVLSQKPTFAFPSGTAVTSKFITKLENVGDEHHRLAGQTTTYGQATKVESPIVAAEGTPAGVIPEGEAAKITATVSESEAEAVGAQVATLSATLNVAEGILALPTSALSEPLAAKSLLELDDGAGHTQVLEVSGATAEGATLVGVVRFLPNFNYPSGTTKVKVATAYGRTRRHLLYIEMSTPALAAYTGVLGVKKPPKEQPFWPVTEGPLQSSGWPMKPTLPLDRTTKEPVRCTAVAVGTKGGSQPWTLALTVRGEVLAWGSNGLGQIGAGGTIGGEQVQFLPAAVVTGEVGPLGEAARLGGAEGARVTAIACGETFSMALDEQHRVWIWGRVERGLGGLAIDEAGTSNSNVAVQVPGLPTKAGERPVAIAGAASTAYCLLENGKVLAWGMNDKGQCGNGEVGGSENARWKPGHEYKAGNKTYDRGTNYLCLKNVVSSVHPGEDATHWSVESHPNVVVPAEVVTLSGVTHIAAGRYHAAAVTSAGDLYTWGFNGDGQIGNGSIAKEGDPPHATPYHVSLEGKKAVGVDCGEWNTIAILEGPDTIARPVTVKLVPKGEIGGEQAAKLRVEWKTTEAASGWSFKAGRSKTPHEEVELAALETQLEEELELAELEGMKEEVEEVEAELAAIAEAIEEEEEGATRYTFTPTLVSEAGGVKTYVGEWEPPSGQITPNIGYTIKLQGPGTWEEPTIFTNGLWQSEYIL